MSPPNYLLQITPITLSFIFVTYVTFGQLFFFLSEN